MELYDFEDPQDLMTAVITLYSAQTTEEQIGETTVELNGVGYNAVDAPIMSSFAKQILNDRRSLTEKQLAVCKAVLRKYKAQLESLQRSTLPPLTARPVFTPKTKVNGTLRADGNRLFFLPEVYPSGQIQSIGFKWRGKSSGWEGPLSISAIEGVERLFSPIALDPSVEEFIEKMSEPEVLSDVIAKSSLFDKQKEAAAFVKRFKRVLLGMAPGTGKTATSIMAANELTGYDDFLIVCPLTLMRNWQNEIKKWLGEDSTIWYGPAQNWGTYYRFVITNYETFIRNLPDFQNQIFKVAIFDESIVMKNRKAVRSEKAEIFSRQLDYVILLSGSPVTKFLDDMWSQLHVIDKSRFSSYWKFVSRYCVTETTQWGTKVVGNQDGAIDRLKEDLSDIYFSCSQEDIADIPDWIFDTMEVPMQENQFKYYYQMEQEFMAELPEDNVIIAGNVLSQLIRLMQLSSNPILLDGPNEGCKWKAVEELLEFEELPAIVWTQFVASADLLSYNLKKAKYRVAKLTGETPQNERQDIVDKFQNGEIDVIIAHPAVGKYGLTLTRARTAIYMERSFNGDDYIQSLYRVKRIGTTISPHVILLIASRPENDYATIDHVVDQVLRFRKDQGIELTKAPITSGLLRSILGQPLRSENG